jgi:hypothetical protein
MTTMTTPAGQPEGGGDAALHERIMQKCQLTRWLCRGLTGLAFAGAVLPILAGVAMAVGNVVLVGPKEKELMDNYGRQLLAAHANADIVPAGAGPEFGPVAQAQKKLDDLTMAHVLITAIQEKELALAGMAVALLGVGTLLTLSLVFFHRRQTLAQITQGLAEISMQLQALQKDGGKG